MKTVKFEVKDGIGRIVLNRPEVGNAFNKDMLLELKYLAESLRDKKDLRVVVIEGEGKHFCAGGDLNWMKEMGESKYSENFEDAQTLYDTYLAIENIPVPVISKVKGAVRGGGMGILSVSDIVIAQRGATFSFSEVKLGLVPSVVSSFALRRIGFSKARRFFLTGEVFDVEKAKEIGLVDEIAGEGELDEFCDRFVKAILSNKPEAVRKTKELLRIYRPFYSECYREITSHILATTRMGEEALEGIREFLERKTK
ncbi:MAG: enoyl-CoA hydratase-related protein [candidate division WOR-3 bacterium]